MECESLGLVSDIQANDGDGGVRKDFAGRELNGRTYDDMPTPLRDFV